MGNEEIYHCYKCGQRLIHSSRPKGTYSMADGHPFLIHTYVCPNYKEVKVLFGTRDNGHAKRILSDDPNDYDWS